MKRKYDKNLLLFCTLLVGCLVLWLVSSIQGDVRKFEIKPGILLPESRTDAARAIDAYESVMNRLMDMTERNLTGINADVKDISRMLVTVDLKLTELSKRVSKIEESLRVNSPQAGPTLKLSSDDSKVQDNRTADNTAEAISDGVSEKVETH